MKTALPLLSQVEVASPCSAQWEEMAGDERVRFCGSCEKNVYNLSAMTTPEIVELIRAKEGRLCARFYRRHDGTMLTADCPVGLHHRIRLRAKRWAGVAAAALSSLFLSGCMADNNPNGGDPWKWLMELVAPKKKPPQPTMGKICPISPNRFAPPVLGEVAPIPNSKGNSVAEAAGVESSSSEHD
jgi:hypothetical protein